MGRTARGTLWRTFGLFVVVEAHLAAAVLYWPDFMKNAPALRSMIPLASIRETFDQLIEGGVYGYVTGQHLFKFCNLVGPIAAILFAVGAVAGEAHRGTLEIWLSRPLSRRRILTERWLAGALATIAPVLLSTLSVPWLLTFVGERCDLAPLMLAAVHQGAFLLAFYALAFLASTLGRAPLPIALGLIFVEVFQLALYLIEKATHWSLYRWVDLDRFLWIQEHRALDLSVVAPLTVFALACYAASLAAFARRTP
jgi:ABC-2 type transport system permease protein